MSGATAPTVATFAEGLGQPALDRPGEPGFLRDLRRRGADAFAAGGLPTPRQEAWRFTNLKEVAATSWAPAREASVDPAPWRPASGLLVVTVNGRVDPGASSLDGLPDGVTVSRLEAALAADDGWLLRHLGRDVDLQEHPLAALNTAHFADAVVVRVAAGAVVDEPLTVLHVSVAGSGDPVIAFPRTLVVLEPGSQATVVERYVSHHPEGSSLDCPVTELRVDKGAVLRHVRLQEQATTARQLGLLQLRLERDATASSHGVVLDGGLCRTDVEATLAGDGADCALDGLYLVDGRRHVDHQVTVRHGSPHGSSRQLFKGVLEDQGRAVFNGKIVVDPGAQKTDAKQSNRNLLLSDEALVNSNPQLEIFADDVRCTHGSTVGRLDEDAVFYLRSRGLDRAAAESLLVYAFAGEVVHRIPVDEVRERMERVLFDRLPRGQVVREAV